jgi:undecaprenyl-diphosphatase
LIAASLLDLFKALVEILRGNIAFLPSATNWNTNNVNISIFSLAISFILSYIVGWACLSWLINFLTKRTFYPFIWYRIGLAVVLLSLVALKLA